MAEYIEREAYIKMVKDIPMWGSVAAMMADRVPAADVVEVKHGRWIEQEAPNMDTYYDCSACGESFCFIDGSPSDNLYLYCPSCGARMDGDGNG